MQENPLSQALDLTQKILQDDSVIKIKYILSAILGVLYTFLKDTVTLTNIESSTVSFLVLLFIIDFATGMWRSLLPKKQVEDCIKCVKKCHNISSEIALRGVLKGIIYIIVVWLGFKLMDSKVDGVLNVVLGGVGVSIIGLGIITEVISILENLLCITNICKIDIPIISMVMRILRKKEQDILNNTTTTTTTSNSSSVDNMTGITINDSSSTTSTITNEQSKNTKSTEE